MHRTVESFCAKTYWPACMNILKKKKMRERRKEPTEAVRPSNQDDSALEVFRVGPGLDGGITYPGWSGCSSGSWKAGWMIEQFLIIGHLYFYYFLSLRFCANRNVVFLPPSSPPRPKTQLFTYSTFTSQGILQRGLYIVRKPTGTKHILRSSQVKFSLCGILFISL